MERKYSLLAIHLQSALRMMNRIQVIVQSKERPAAKLICPDLIGFAASLSISLSVSQTHEHTHTALLSRPNFLMRSCFLSFVFFLPCFNLPFCRWCSYTNVTIHSAMPPLNLSSDAVVSNPWLSPPASFTLSGIRSLIALIINQFISPFASRSPQLNLFVTLPPLFLLPWLGSTRSVLRLCI